MLTSCTKRKGRERGPAKEVYKGSVRNLFKLAEEMGFECFVVSAKYGLIGCDEVIEPYDVYLKELNDQGLKRLKVIISSKCPKLRGPWEVVITNLSSAYASITCCEILAQRALIIGSRPPGLRALYEVHYKYKTLGERNRLLKNIKELIRESFGQL